MPYYLILLTEYYFSIDELAVAKYFQSATFKKHPKLIFSEQIVSHCLIANFCQANLAGKYLVKYILFFLKFLKKWIPEKYFESMNG